jgi:hypothetical protein
MKPMTSNRPEGWMEKRSWRKLEVGPVDVANQKQLVEKNPEMDSAAKAEEESGSYREYHREREDEAVREIERRLKEMELEVAHLVAE